MTNTKGKRSQAALEFLMTYGWAILVVLIVISALAYFGVLNPQMLLPSRCTMPTGFGCQDYVAEQESETITLAITNGMGQSVTITDINLAGQGGIADCEVHIDSDFQNGDSLANGEQTSVTFNCQHVSMGVDDGIVSLGHLAGGNQKYRWTINLKYHLSDSTSAFTKSLQGELFTTVEE